MRNRLDLVFYGHGERRGAVMAIERELPITATSQAHHCTLNSDIANRLGNNAKELTFWHHPSFTPETVLDEETARALQVTILTSCNLTAIQWETTDDRTEAMYWPLERVNQFLNLLESSHSKDNIETISFLGVRGTDNSYREFGNFFLRNSLPALNSFFLSKFELSGSTMFAPEPPLNSLMKGLAALPALKHSQFYWDHDNICGEELCQLFESTTLEELDFGKIYASNSRTVNHLENGLKASTTITKVLLDTSLAGRIDLYSVFQTAKSLKKLFLFVPDWKKHDLLLSIIRNIGSSTLQSVTMHGRTRAAVSQQVVGSLVEEAILCMLEKNYYLSEFECIGRVSTSFQEKIKFYIGLNGAGRLQLLPRQNTTANEWILVLANVQGEISHLFYFLSRAPMLFSSSTDLGSNAEHSSGALNPRKRRRLQSVN